MENDFSKKIKIEGKEILYKPTEDMLLLAMWEFTVLNGACSETDTDRFKSFFYEVYLTVVDSNPLRKKEDFSTNSLIMLIDALQSLMKMSHTRLIHFVFETNTKDILNININKYFCIK
jgi:hypothetical protein